MLTTVKMSIVFLKRTKFFVNDVSFRKKANDGRMTWIVQRNKKQSFFKNKRTFFTIRLKKKRLITERTILFKIILINCDNVFTEQTILLNERFNWTTTKRSFSKKTNEINEKWTIIFFWTIEKKRTKWIVHDSFTNDKRTK